MTIRCLAYFALLVFPSLVAAQHSLPENNYATLEPAGTSVLSIGKWYKIGIPQSGIYRLTYEDIAGMGFSDPSQVRIFGNGGKMLPLMNSTPRFDDLIENKVYMYTGSDGNFNPGDFILFYAEGPVTWKYNQINSMFEQQIHLYSEVIYYFITTDAGAGLKINTRASFPGTPSATITTFDDYSYREKNLYNFLKSGRQWFGDKIDNTPFDSVFIFDNLVTLTPVKVSVNVASRSEFNRRFSFYTGNTLFGSIITDTVNPKNKTGPYASQHAAVFSFNAAGDQVNIKVLYNKGSVTDEGYVDYITLNARRNLVLVNDVLFFRDKTLAGTSSLVRFTVENCDQQTEIWDMTDPFNISRVPVEISGNSLSFTDSTGILKEYVAIRSDGSFPKPDIQPNGKDIGLIPNQNLHATDPHEMLIVTHPLFREAADSIAEFHRQHDQLGVFVVNTDQLHNEFSSGAADVCAIRDFARFLYNKSSGENDRLKYLLLVGDGSYNNISTAQGNANYILTYQSANSLNPSQSYVSDDFFGMLEDSEGGSVSMRNFSLDLGIGRLPVKTAKEAMSVYNKIKYYNSYANKGDWQNNILFAADDQDANLHMKQADQIAGWMDGNYPEYAVKKVLIDAYPQVSSSVGTRYPEANRIILSNMEKGLLVFNYTGHGGESALADEQILVRDDIAKLKNLDNLPLFITATCEFSRFDDLIKDEKGNITESTSAGEMSILNANGGSIALVTTTRIVYSTENHELNWQFYQVVLSRNAEGHYYTLGEALTRTKNLLGDSQNKLNFILLGDPAMKLAIPGHNVVTDSINHTQTWGPIDTLKAFSRVIVSGHIENNDLEVVNTFNGVLYASVYDKRKTVTTLANDPDELPFQFNVRENLLFKGKVSVTNGYFTVEFIVPKDITYNYGNGRIIYYAYSEDSDANGEFSGFVIGGTNPDAVPDDEGPVISLYLNDEQFNNQGITSPNPVIYALIRDESGINTVGNGIGHEITGVIDGNVAYPVIMNDYFESALNDNTSGTISYPMESLTEGLHSLKVKVWDIFNNSSETTIEFKVVSGERILISKAGNYPNPARDHTSFIFEHNKAGEELQVTLSVYDMEGRLITSFRESLYTTGFNTILNEWDLRDGNGNLLKQGIYPYRIRITDNNGSYSDSYQKLVVIR